MSVTERFKHSTPALYDRYMGPLLFEPYSSVVAARAAQLQPRRILETAAGTGILTQALSLALPDADIVATDINPSMLEFAAQRLTSERVRFQAADAQDLPFESRSFDLIVCQFGAMFFPDRVRAHREALRTMRPTGHYLLVSFDALALNGVPRVASEAVAALFPDDPPSYMERGPFSYADPEVIRRDLERAGFTHVEVETVALSSRVHARDAAEGIVLGSPFRAEIERRNPSSLERALDAVTEALTPWDGGCAPMSAHVVVAGTEQRS